MSDKIVTSSQADLEMEQRTLSLVNVLFILLYLHIFCDIIVFTGFSGFYFFLDFIIDRRGCFIQPMKIQKLHVENQWFGMAEFHRIFISIGKVYIDRNCIIIMHNNLFIVFISRI